jgi:hypothetical protein
MRLHVGTSTDADAGAAVAEAVADAATRALGDIPWAGAVTPAILAGRRVLQHGIGIGVIDCDRVQVRVGAAGSMRADARAVRSDAEHGTTFVVRLPSSPA